MGYFYGFHTVFFHFFNYSTSGRLLQGLKKQNLDKIIRKDSKGKRQNLPQCPRRRHLKKFDFPLWSDTVFVSFISFLFFFCLLRFYLPGLWLTLVLSLVFAAGIGLLFHLFLKGRRSRRFQDGETKKNVQKLAFHLAIDAPETETERLAKSLSVHLGTQVTRTGDRLDTPYGAYYPMFSLSPVSADEIAKVVRSAGKDKTVCAATYTPEAEALADAFGIRLMDAENLYDLFSRTGNLPEQYMLPERKRSIKEGIRRRIKRSSYRGYLLAGCLTLLFSLFTFFPVYYIVAGSLMLAAAILVRFFGKA